MGGPDRVDASTLAVAPFSAELITTSTFHRLPVPVARNRPLTGVTAVLSIQLQTPVVGRRTSPDPRVPSCLLLADRRFGR